MVFYKKYFGDEMKINECESLHELPITPQILRDIAAEMEQKGKNEFFQHGQVVRYKFSHLFSFVYKPEKKAMISISEEVRDFNAEHE